MGRKEVSFSDLSGRQFNPGDEPARVVVLEHPDLPGGPVALEALPLEVAPALDAALDVAILEVHLPGEEKPRRVVVEADSFDALAADTPMAALLKNAPTVVKQSSAKASRSERIDYATLEHAGTPHRGKVTAEEARIVREHLAEVNQRLAADGVRQIDPATPADAEKYGFTLPAPAVATPHP